MTNVMPIENANRLIDILSDTIEVESLKKTKSNEKKREK